MTYALDPGRLALADLRRTWSAPQPISIDAGARPGVDAAAAAVARVIAEHRVVYGVNTGFGLLARTRIDDARLAELQRALLLSHSAGTGPLLDAAVVRLMLAPEGALRSRAATPACAGELIEALVTLANADVLPCVPSQGSVGASGDLAPLAHLCARAHRRGRGARRRARPAGRDALARAGLAPLTLAPKEGLALINGTQVSTALALDGLFAARAGDRGGARRGRDERRGVPRQRHAVRRAHPRAARHAGQRDAASAYRAAAARKRDIAPRTRTATGCRIRTRCAASPRCTARCSTGCVTSAATLVVEANAVSDNPLVFADATRCSPAGISTREPVAFAADNARDRDRGARRASPSGASSCSWTRTSRDCRRSSSADGGVDSGFMIAQVTAAALASENKALAHPRSVDSIPTSANKEDHVSMATDRRARGSRRWRATCRAIVAIELLAAAQGSTSASRSRRRRRSRRRTRACAPPPARDRDRAFAPDLAAVRAQVERGDYVDDAPEALVAG